MQYTCKKDYVFIKFLDECPHAESFQDGHMLMNSAHYFNIDIPHKENIDLFDGRWNTYDSASFVFNPDKDGNVDLSNIDNPPFKSLWIHPQSSMSPLIVTFDKISTRTKLLCLYGLNRPDLCVGKMRDSISEKILDQLGQYYVMILDTESFFGKVRESFKKYDDMGSLIKAGWGPMHYIDEFEHNGPHGTFVAPEGLSYLKEFRVFVQATQESDPFWFEIGDLSSISVIGKTSDLLDTEVREDKSFTLLSIPRN